MVEEGKSYWRTYPWPPVLGGAPVAPSVMVRAVTLKLREVLMNGRKAVLDKAVRIIVIVEMLMYERGFVRWRSGEQEMEETDKLGEGGGQLHAIG